MNESQYITVSFMLGVSKSLCKPPNWCKIKLLSLEVIFIARRKDRPQKAAMREMMSGYLKLVYEMSTNETLALVKLS